MKYDFDRQLYFYGPRIMEVVKGQKISKGNCILHLHSTKS